MLYTTFEGLGMSPEERALLDDAGRATRDGGPALETALRRLDAFERMSQVREAADASELNRDAFRFALILQSMALSASLIVAAAAAWLVLRSERQLQRGKDLAQATLEGIREGVITVDAQGAVQLMNTRAESMTGWSMDDAKGRALAEVYRLVGDEGRQPFTHPAQHPVSAPMASPDGTRLVARDGRQYEVQDSASARLGTRLLGKVTFVVLGALQMSFTGQFIPHLSISDRSPPELKLRAPDKVQA